MTNLGQAVNIVKSLILQGQWIFGEGDAEGDAEEAAAAEPKFDKERPGIGLGLDTNLPLSTIRQSVELDSPVVDGHGNLDQAEVEGESLRHDLVAPAEEEANQASVRAGSVPTTTYSFLSDEPPPMTKAQRRKSSLASLGLWTSNSTNSHIGPISLPSPISAAVFSNQQEPHQQRLPTP